jgi:hypothetical protein
LRECEDARPRLDRHRCVSQVEQESGLAIIEAIETKLGDPLGRERGRFAITDRQQDRDALLTEAASRERDGVG